MSLENRRIRIALYMMMLFALANCNKVNFAAPDSPVKALICVSGSGVVCDELVSPDPNKFDQHETSTTISTTSKVDILFVVDTSGSMAMERGELANRLTDFTDNLGALDWNLCYTTTDTYRDAGNLLEFGNSGLYALNYQTPDFKQKFLDAIDDLKTVNGTSDEQGNKAMGMAINRADSRCIRSDAALSTIILSDEDEHSTGGYDQYRNHAQFKELSSENMPEHVAETVRTRFGGGKIYTHHSLVIKSGDSACFAQQDAPSHPAFYGTRYEALSKMTGGIIGNICSANYGNELKGFAERISNTLSSVTLECVPEAAVNVSITPRPARVDVQQQGNKLVFNPPLPANTFVEAKYFCRKAGQ